MNKVAFTNHGETIKHLGPVTVWPGETREVDPRDLPNFKAAPVEAVADVDPIAETLKGTIKEINAALTAQSDAELDALESAEMDQPKPRAGVVDAIAAERLRRASED